MSPQPTWCPTFVIDFTKNIDSLMGIALPGGCPILFKISLYFQPLVLCHINIKLIYTQSKLPFTFATAAFCHLPDQSERKSSRCSIKFHRFLSDLSGSSWIILNWLKWNMSHVKWSRRSREVYWVAHRSGREVVQAQNINNVGMFSSSFGTLLKILLFLFSFWEEQRSIFSTRYLQWMVFPIAPHCCWTMSPSRAAGCWLGEGKK